MTLRHIFFIILLIVSASCTRSSVEKVSNSATAKLYHNGAIITMEGDSATFAEALVIDSGRIVFAGPKQSAWKQFPKAVQQDLSGATMLPGFIDAHGHAWMVGFQRASANLLPPPDGTVTDIESLRTELRNWIQSNPAFIKKSGWIIGFGYDDAQLKEQRHPTADDLDQISTELPVLIIHQSAHLASVNHRALELIDYTSKTKDPSGGVIRREKDGKTPNGVLEETAMMKAAFGLIRKFDDEDNERMALAGLMAYAEFGFTTAQEGRASAANLKTWKRLADKQQLILDVAVYPDIYMEQALLKGRTISTQYENHFRFAGIKMSLDGSPQGRTAWLSQPYLIPPDGKDASYAGYPAFPNNYIVDTLVMQAYKNKWPILAHCNGDMAAETLINSVEKANAALGKADRRTVVIHAQTVRFDQLDRMKAEGIMPSFFSMHTFYWGDWHRDVTLGRDRAYRISPTHTALQKGMIFTEHHDAPVALPSSIMILHTTVNRVSRSGDIIGPEERVTPYQALKSITEWAAYQYFEEQTKGTLMVGKLADLVIIDKNPLAIDPMTIKDIKVLETIKEGVTVFKRSRDSN
jgi:predicted amidohydrolase YtcJ